MILSEGYPLNERYEIRGRLGAGGMATVYEAVDTIGRGLRRCAIKELLPADLNPSYRQAIINAFRKEAAILRDIQHPSLPKFYDFFKSGDGYYLVLELIDGPDLQEYVTPGEGLPEQEVLHWMDQVMDALIVCHELDLVHGDIKPANITLATDRAYLIDFGAAWELLSEDKTEEKTRPRLRGVSDSYSPLEYYGPGDPDGRRSDVYSLGATMYFLLTGKPPLHPIDRALGNEMERPRMLVPSISEPVDTAVMTALEIEPRKRFQKMTDFRKALLPAAGAAATTAPVAAITGGHEDLIACGDQTIPPSIALPQSRRLRLDLLLRRKQTAKDFRIGLSEKLLPISLAVAQDGKALFLGWSGGQVSQYRVEGDMLRCAGTVQCDLPVQSITPYRSEGNQGLSCDVLANDSSCSVLIDIPSPCFVKGVSTLVAPRKLLGSVKHAARCEQELFLLYVEKQGIYLGRFDDQEREPIPECRKPVGLVVTPKALFVAGTVLDSGEKRSRVWFWDRYHPGKWQVLPDIPGEALAIIADPHTKSVLAIANAKFSMNTLAVFNASSGNLEGCYRLGAIPNVRAACVDPQYLWVLAKQALYRLPRSWYQKQMLP